MRHFLIGLTSVSAILLAMPAIAQDPTSFQSGFQESDARNGIVTDSRGFRQSWGVTGSNTIVQTPGIDHWPRHRSFGRPIVIITPDTVVLPQRPVIIPAPRRGIIIAPTINFGGGFSSGLCTTTNIVTSSDGTVFRSSTTQPCNF